MSTTRNSTDRQSLGAREIYDALRADIANGVLLPGMGVPEISLATRFGVSRTPVREALRRLQQDRLIVRGEQGRGFEVRGIDPLEVLQVYDLRILLEGEAAARAANARTVVDVAHLEGLLARDSADPESDVSTRTQRNLEFHAAVWAAARNAVLDDLLRRLTTRIVGATQSTLSVGNRWAEVLDEHARLVEAISSQNAEAAREIAVEHLRKAREIRLGLLRDSAGRSVPE